MLWPPVTPLPPRESLARRLGCEVGLQYCPLIMCDQEGMTAMLKTVGGGILELGSSGVLGLENVGHLTRGGEAAWRF